MQVAQRIEIGVCVLIILFCGAIVVEALGLPAGHFEPLGSAPFPMAIAGLVGALCLIAIVQVARRQSEDTEEPDRSTGKALFFLAMIAGYAALFASRLVDFGIMTTGFLFLTIGGLERFNRKLMPWIVGVSLIVGMGTSFIFTRFLFVDLPVWF